MKEKVSSEKQSNQLLYKFIPMMFPTQILLYLFDYALLLHVSSRPKKWACEVIGRLVIMVFMKDLINLLH